MKTKQEEVIVLEALTEDQIKSLPKDAVVKVTSLNGDLPNKQLQEFIPVVQKYIELRDKALKLKLEKDEDGKITKESIQAYKDLKSDQRSFNGDLGRSIKKIKDPLNAIKNDVLAVEKTFKSESDKIKVAAEKEFEEYEEELQRKKDEAQARKDAEMNAKIEEANAEADKIKEQQEKTNIYNKIMYHEIGGNLRDVVIDSLDNSNVDALARLKASIAQRSFEDVCPENIGILEENVIQELEKAFYERKTWAVQKIDDKIDQMEKEDRERFLKNQIPPAPYVPVSKPDHMNHHAGVSEEDFPVPENNDEYIRNIISAIIPFRNNVKLRINGQYYNDPKLSKLLNDLETLINNNQ